MNETVAHVCWCGYPDQECICPAGVGVNAPENVTERDGLSVGDEVLVAASIFDLWFAVVECFTAVTCDVVVRWIGKRPTMDERSTICRKQLTVSPTANIECVNHAHVEHSLVCMPECFEPSASGRKVDDRP